MFISSMQSVTKKSIDQFMSAYQMRNKNSSKRTDKLQKEKLYNERSKIRNLISSKQ
jgi:hypothetical protein